MEDNEVYSLSPYLPIALSPHHQSPIIESPKQSYAGCECTRTGLQCERISNASQEPESDA